MDPLSVTASAIAILQISGTIINICYDYRSRVKNATKEASRIVNELNGLRSVIDLIFVLLEDESANIAQQSALDTLAQDDGPLVRCLTELKALEKKLEPKKGWKAAKSTILWPLKESDVKMVLHTIDRTKSTVQLALAVDQRKASSAIQDSVTYLSQQFSKSVLSTRREAIFKWLSSANPMSSHAAARKKCKSMTGLWFTQGPQFEQWLNSPNSFVWISGIPGCGKTILCSSIIDALFTRYHSVSEAALAFFYLDFNDNNGSKVETLIRSIIAQLSGQKPEVPAALEKLFSQNQEGANQPTLKDLLTVLSQIIKEFNIVYIIIDALDECPELDEAIQMLLDFRQWSIEDLHVLVTSRHLLEIESYISDLTTDQVCLNGRGMEQDITIYIEDTLKEDQKLAKWPLEVRDEIRVTLSDGAHGMFRWVECQLETLKACLTVVELRKRLRALPKTLEDTYDGILLRIEESHRQSTLKILQWLAFAAMPVTIEEAAEVVAVDLGTEPSFNPDLRLFNPRDVMTLCSSLVIRESISAKEVWETSRTANAPYLEEYSNFHRTDREVIRLAHLSVKDYLISDRIKTGKAHHFAIDAKLSNTFIAQTCLVCLLTSTIPLEYWDTHGIQNASIKWPLYPYAAHFWPFHVKASGESLNDTTWHLLQRFFRTKHDMNGNNFAAWALYLQSDISLERVMHTEPLYYAASFGITPLIQKLLDSDPDINIEAGGGRFESPPLQVAVYRNHPEAVKLLLEAGANPMALNRLGESSLYWATMRDHTEVYALLKSYGAALTEQEVDKLDRLNRI